MAILQLILISVGLAMDAFAVSVCRGLKMEKMNYPQAAAIALCFGGFQALMPFLGWAVGIQFEQYITKFDHWIAFLLLAFIGGKMIWEALKGGEEDCCPGNDSLHLKELLLMGIATSIDALAVGITFALLPDTNIALSVAFIGIITFALSFVGVIIGNKFGSRFKRRAELFGGAVLILIGIKILTEHLFFS
ncbi:MAG: manganese efflux pump MntP family protein [Oscillospiraceae bacterium]